jgi:Arc/MetJ-type ribon-helix-helix transcriptional regulator
MTQLVTRVADDLIARVDALVDEGTVASRSEAVRRGLEMLVDRERRRRVAEAIVGGYRSLPQSEEEVGWADAATRRMIAEEPW